MPAQNKVGQHRNRVGVVTLRDIWREADGIRIIIMPVFAASLRHADNLSLALDARSYEEGIHRTHWHEMRVHARDGVFCAACAVYVAALVLVALL